MTWQVEFDEQRRVVYRTFQAEVSHQEIRDSSVAVIAIMHAEDTYEIITDFTDTVSLPATSVDIVSVPDTL